MVNPPDSSHWWSWSGLQCWVSRTFLLDQHASCWRWWRWGGWTPSPTPLSPPPGSLLSASQCKPAVRHMELYYVVHFIKSISCPHRWNLCQRVTHTRPNNEPTAQLWKMRDDSRHSEQREEGRGVWGQTRLSISNSPSCWGSGLLFCFFLDIFEDNCHTAVTPKPDADVKPLEGKQTDRADT